MGLFGKKDKLKIMEKTINTASAEEAISTEEDAVYTSLVFHEEWESSKQEEYVFKFHHQQLPSLKPNQISISGVKLTRVEDDVVILAFLRNTLDKAVRFEVIDLLLLDENGKTLARKAFDLSTMGEIPALSSVPWRFLFEEPDILDRAIPDEGWKIAFELKNQKREHELDLAPLWKEQLPEAQQENLRKLVAGLPKLNEGEVNFMGLEAKFKDNEQLAVTVLIRNGSEKQIKIEKLPLVVEDGNGDQVCQGGFSLDDFEVKANTSKPWTFIFPGELVKKKNPDLSRWKVYPPSSV
ncbi:accessory Sec system S-layer assembly protein [Peribacillus sp. NPDC097224]|uniref:accessory Sec system S-layer assembly protein n=1 Tax=Peribacillus sp. NPDC097224 TaxID=3364399 RepID=UPI00380937A8